MFFFFLCQMGWGVDGSSRTWVDWHSSLSQLLVTCVHRPTSWIHFDLFIL
jgi:hypothetical protein